MRFTRRSRPSHGVEDGARHHAVTAEADLDGDRLRPTWDMDRKDEHAVVVDVVGQAVRASADDGHGIWHVTDIDVVWFA